jgi:hypothetical protein
LQYIRSHENEKLKIKGEIKMKKKLSLMNLGREDRLAQEKMDEVYAGAASTGDCVGDCVCGCLYAGQGGSSTQDNLERNFSGHLGSPGCVAVTAPGGGAVG